MVNSPNAQLSILSVHTPTSSFAVLHSITRESLTDLFDKVSQKVHKDYNGQRVGPGWLKYEYNESIWNLDDDSDYAIFVWRSQQYQFGSPDLTTTNHSASTPTTAIGEPGPSRLSHTGPAAAAAHTPTLHLHDPLAPLPPPKAYQNPSFYAFRPRPAPKSSSAPSSSGRSSRRSGRKTVKDEDDGRDGVPKLMKQFERFHNENGVRTVIGSIGPVQNVRMLLKSGYRHVYISRKFAQKHGFIPSDATPGNYGYGGLVNIGIWPITLVTSSSSNFGGMSDHDDGESPAVVHNDISGHESLLRPPARAGAIGLGISGVGQGHSRRSPGSSHLPTSTSTAPGAIARTPSRSSTRAISPLLDGTILESIKKTEHQHHDNHGPQQAETRKKPTVTEIQVYLSEEPHFDVVLGRSFFEKRQIKTSTVDPTDIVCMDTGEKIECEIVILKDGKGEIVTVT